MPDYDDTNSGVLFINDRREKETQPNMRGSINVDGKDYWISAWTKTSDNVDGKFLSLAVTAKDETRSPDGTGATTKPDFDDSVPF